MESVTGLFASLLPAVEQRLVKLLCSLCFYVCFSQSIQDTKVFVIPQFCSIHICFNFYDIRLENTVCILSAAYFPKK